MRRQRRARVLVFPSLVPRKPPMVGPDPRPVVVLDSSEGVRAAADKQLSAAGYNVIVTNDPSRMGELTLACDARLVLCEREGVGLKVLHALQADPRTAACP